MYFILGNREAFTCQNDKLCVQKVTKQKVSWQIDILISFNTNIIMGIKILNGNKLKLCSHYLGLWFYGLCEEKKKTKRKNERIHWLQRTEYIRYGGQKPEEKSFQALLSACVCYCAHMDFLISSVIMIHAKKQNSFPFSF